MQHRAHQGGQGATPGLLEPPPRSGGLRARLGLRQQRANHQQVLARSSGCRTRGATNGRKSNMRGSNKQIFQALSTLMLVRVVAALSGSISAKCKACRTHSLKASCSVTHGHEWHQLSGTKTKNRNLSFPLRRWE